MSSRFPHVSRRSKVVVASAVGLAFAAVAGVALAQVTAGSSNEAAPTSKKVKPTTTVTTTVTTGTTVTITITIPVTTTVPATTGPPVSSVPTTTPPTTPPTTATTPGTTSTSAAQGKVVICHHTGSKKHPFHTITVAAPAVQAHITNHRDTPGPCPVVTTPTPTTVQAVTTTSAKTKKPKKPKKQHPQHSQAPSGASSQKSSNRGQSKKTQIPPRSQVNGRGGQGKGHGNGK